MLTEAGSHVFKDSRLNSYNAAVEWAVMNNLRGVVCYSPPILDCLEKSVELAHSNGLLLFTYGAPNNIKEVADRQKRMVSPLVSLTLLPSLLSLAYHLFSLASHSLTLSSLLHLALLPSRLSYLLLSHSLALSSLSYPLFSHSLTLSSLSLLPSLLSLSSLSLLPSLLSLSSVFSILS